NLEAFITIHFEAARMLTPIMSYFDPRPYEKVEIRVQWGTISDVWSTVNSAAVNAETALEVEAIQSGEGAEQIAYNRLTMFDEQTLAAGVFNNLTINIPRAGFLAGILIRSYASNVPINTVFTDTAAGFSNQHGAISLKSDNNFLHIDNL